MKMTSCLFKGQSEIKDLSTHYLNSSIRTRNPGINSSNNITKKEETINDEYFSFNSKEENKRDNNDFANNVESPYNKTINRNKLSDFAKLESFDKKLSSNEFKNLIDSYYNSNSKFINNNLIDFNRINYNEALGLDFISYIKANNTFHKQEKLNFPYFSNQATEHTDYNNNAEIITTFTDKRNDSSSYIFSDINNALFEASKLINNGMDISYSMLGSKRKCPYNNNNSNNDIDCINNKSIVKKLQVKNAVVKYRQKQKLFQDLTIKENKILKMILKQAYNTGKFKAILENQTNYNLQDVIDKLILEKPYFRENIDNTKYSYANKRILKEYQASISRNKLDNNNNNNDSNYKKNYVIVNDEVFINNDNAKLHHNSINNGLEVVNFNFIVSSSSCINISNTATTTSTTNTNSNYTNIMSKNLSNSNFSKSTNTTNNELMLNDRMGIISQEKQEDSGNKEDYIENNINYINSNYNTINTTNTTNTNKASNTNNTSKNNKIEYSEYNVFDAQEESDIFGDIFPFQDKSSNNNPLTNAIDINSRFNNNHLNSNISYNTYNDLDAFSFNEEKSIFGNNYMISEDEINKNNLDFSYFDYMS